MHGKKWIYPVTIVAFCLVGCGSDDNGPTTGIANTGGQTAASSQAGNGNTGGGSGTIFASGGSSGTGGAQAGGGNSATGGSSHVAGSSGVAGGSTVGGANATGGASTSQAGSSTAGSSTAGSAGTLPGASGGALGTGGAETGGTMTGGAGTGGAGTGGLTNRPNVICGNGVVDPGEDCDDGNSLEDDGCTTDCRYGCNTVKDCDDKNPCTADSCGPTVRGFACAYETLVGAKCDDGDSCTAPDTCDATAKCLGGTNSCNCKVDGDCKNYEDGNACNGTLHCLLGQCVINPFTVITCDITGDTDCRKSLCNPTTGVCSLVNSTEGSHCDDGLFCTAVDTCHNGSCTGTSDPCQGYACGIGCDETNRHCVAASAGTTCRAVEGTCDIAETCNGVTFECPADARMASGITCRAAGGACDIAEKCNGLSPNCPDDALEASGKVCRPPVGTCDVAETCDGTGRDCPENAFAAAGSICRAKAGDCDIAEICTGSNGECPPEAYADATTACRPAVGPCDVTETCSGAGAQCPADAVATSGTVCRPAASTCDAAETCNGTAATCPENAFLAAGTPCNDGLACTVQDSCNSTGQCGVSTPIAPPAPKLLWPTNGWLTGSAKGAAVGSMALRPLLRWEAAASDGCGSVTYDVQLDNSCVVTALKTCAFPTPELSAAGITVTSYRPDNDLAVNATAPVGTVYAWRVRACRANACSSWTQPRYVNVGRAANDFNGDGYSDLAISAPEAQSEGRVFVYYGSAIGVVTAAQVTLSPPTSQAAEAYGAATAAGDFDGDGFADLAVGAPLFDGDPDLDIGRAYLYRGGATGLETAPSLVLSALAPEAGAKFGFALALEGDINGDGRDDLAIGEPLRDTANVDEGIVSVHLGHSLSASDIESFKIGMPGPATNGNFGSVLTLGDVNGDGASDLVAGAAGTARGSIVFLGELGLLALPSPIDQATGGNAVAANGDTDGSGRINLMFGMNNNMWHGWLCDGSYFYSYDGTATGIVGTGNPSRGCNYGYALGNGGDLDGDGLFDSVAASPYEGPGMVVLFHGTQGASMTGWYEIWNPDNVTGGQFGYAIGTRGDFDADGLADLVITAPEQNAVYLFAGKSTGPAVAPTLTLNGAGKFGRAVPR